MNPGVILIGVLAAVAFVAVANKPKESEILGMEDKPVSIENIRKGVSRGWYQAVLTRVDGKPAIRLSGKTTDGQQVVDTFWISQKDFDTLQDEGYLIEL